jgi:glutamine amidotransferase
MCRWLAYTGGPIFLEELILKPEHSLIDQSLASKEGAETTNGDGFGVGWYGEPAEPGLYKDIEPAWNDRNLADLALDIKSALFLAHVRATTGTPIQRTNCHPFRHGKWLFVHNGLIRGYDRLRRDLAFNVDPGLYSAIEGTTDSEIMFYLALTFGLESEPLAALERMAGLVETTGVAHAVEHPLQMTLGLSDGQRLYAVRYSSERGSRTLYHSKSMEALRRINPELERFSTDARAIVSEPLSDMTDHWSEIPESSAIVIEGGEISTHAFEPQR